MRPEARASGGGSSPPLHDELGTPSGRERSFAPERRETSLGPWGHGDPFPLPLAPVMSVMPRPRKEVPRYLKRRLDRAADRRLLIDEGVV